MSHPQGGPYGAPMPPPGYPYGPAYPAPRPSRPKNGIALGAAAVIGYVLLVTVSDFAIWGYYRAAGLPSGAWQYVLLAMFLFLACCWLAAVIVYSVDTGIRSRWPAAVLSLVGVLLFLVGPWTGAILFGTVLRVAAFVGAWVLARRTSPVGLLAAVVAGAGAALARYLSAEVIARGWAGDLWPGRTFVMFTVPVVLIGVASCWLAVLIDKKMPVRSSNTVG